MQGKFNNFHKIGVNLFKKDSYRLQLEITDKNKNYLYYMNQIDNLHNDFFQIIYDYSLLGLLLIIIILFWIMNKCHDPLIPLVFFILAVGVFHNLIYSPALLFFSAPLIASGIKRNQLQISKSSSIIIIVVLFISVVIFTQSFVKADYLNKEGLMDVSRLQKARKLVPGYYFPYSIIPQHDISQIGLIDKAISLREDPNFYVIKAKQSENLYFSTGNIDLLNEALKAFRASINIDPLNIKTRILLYDLYNLTGMTDEASNELHYINNLNLPSGLKNQIHIQNRFRETFNRHHPGK